MSTVRDDIDIAELWRAIKRRYWLVFGLPFFIGIAAFFALTQVTPQYASEARLLIDSEENVYTRPAIADRPTAITGIDQAVVTSQVQVLTSSDLALKVIQRLDLKNNPEFNETLSPNGFLDNYGLRKSITPRQSEELVLAKFKKKLTVFPVLASHVIKVQFSSENSALAADIANAVVEEYLAWHRDAKLRVNRGATNWLRGQIEALRIKVKEAEARAEKFRAKTGQQAGSGAPTLSGQQLSELNSQLIVATAQRSEAEARAKLIRKMIRSRQNISAASDVVRSPLIQRLLEQQATIERTRAELSATLLPGHPRIKQLNAELTGLKRLIRTQINKVASSLENEAEIARAREASLISSLNSLMTISADASEDTIQLRALQREAKANRDLLESYLARYRDASARRDSESIPANATIISRAHASTVPSFPKKFPMAALAAAAALLLTLTYVVSGALMNSLAAGSIPHRRTANPISREVGEPSVIPEPVFAPSTPQLQDEQAEQTLDRSPEPSTVTQDADAFEKDLQEEDDPGAPNATYRDMVQAAVKNPETQTQQDDEQRGIFNSIDRLVEHVRVSTTSDNGYRILFTAIDDGIETCSAAIGLSRALSKHGCRVVLVDLSQGQKSLSGTLGIARTPGYSEMVSGDISREEVTRADTGSDLHIIPSGRPEDTDPAIPATENKILADLDRTYEVVILHATTSTARAAFKRLDADFDAGILIAPSSDARQLASLTDNNFLGFTVTGLDVAYYDPEAQTLLQRDPAASDAKILEAS